MNMKNKQVSSSDLSDPVDYARRVYDHNLDWYKNADTKAEIILTLDGVFLAFVTSSIFMNQADLLKILGNFTTLTWLFLWLMSLSLAGSIICSISCLWSRISLANRRTKERYFAERKIEVDKLETYVPEATFFFQKISWLDPDLFRKLMLTVDKEFEISALAADTHTLSRNVLRKHQRVDFSFILAGTSLLFFLALCITYLLALCGPSNP